MKEKIDQLLQILQRLDPATAQLLTSLWARLRDTSTPHQWIQK